MSKKLRMGKFDDEESEEEEDDDVEEEEEEGDDEIEPKNNITVKVKKEEKGSKSNEEIYIKIERDIELRWPMIHYCDELGLDYRNTKFMFNGARVRDTDTPFRLSMRHRDVIHVFPNSNNHGVHGRSAVCYETLCIRMHNKRDSFMRVTPTDPILPQLKRHFSNEEAGKHFPTCFVFNGLKLKENHTVNSLNMEDGDIIDAFDFDESSSSLSIISPICRRLNIQVKNLHGQVSSFRAKRSTPFKLLANKYIEMFSSESDKVAFFYNSHRLALDKTMEEEQLVDGCQIHAISTPYTC